MREHPERVGAPERQRTTATEEAAREPERRMTPEEFHGLAQRFNAMQQGQQQPQDYRELRGRGFIPNTKRGRVFNVVKYMADERSGALDRNVAGQQRQAYSQAQAARTAAGMTGDYLQHLDRTRQSGAEEAQASYWRARAEHLNELTRHGVTTSGKPMDLSYATPWDEDISEITKLIEKWETEFNENRLGMMRVGEEIENRDHPWWQKIPVVGGMLPEGGGKDVEVYEQGLQRTVFASEGEDYVRRMITSQSVLMSRLDSAYDEMDRRGVPWSRLNYDTGERLQAQDQRGGPGAGAPSGPPPGRPAPSQVRAPSAQDTMRPGPTWRGAPEHQEYIGSLAPKENQAVERSGIERGIEVVTRPRAEGAGPGTASKGSTEPSSATRDRSTYASRIRRASARYGTDPHIVAAIIQAESSFDPAAMSSAGAYGLGQMMPKTAAQYGLDTSDPAKQIDAAAEHFASLQKQFPDNLDLALQAYNAGAGRVKRSLAGGDALKLETREYPSRVRAAISSALENAANHQFDTATFGTGEFGVGGGPITSPLGSSEEPWGPEQDRQVTPIESSEEDTGPARSKVAAPINPDDFDWTKRGPRNPLSIPDQGQWGELDAATRSFYAIMLDYQARGADINSAQLQTEAIKLAERITKGR